MSRPTLNQVMWVAWPSFLAAGVMEMLVFAFVDPGELHTVADLGWSRSALYSLSFFAFWVVIAVASGTTLWLSAAGEGTDRRARSVVRPGDDPAGRISSGPN